MSTNPDPVFNPLKFYAEALTLSGFCSVLLFAALTQLATHSTEGTPARFAGNELEVCLAPSTPIPTSATAESVQ